MENLKAEYFTITDDDEKSGFIFNNFDSIGNKEEWDFFVSLLGNEETYDLVKVEIYKIIEITDFLNSVFNIENIKNQLLQLLKNEKDELVKQYGFMSLEPNFSNFYDILEFCLETVENDCEDEIVRYNAFHVIYNSKNRDAVNSFRDRLLKIKDFSENTGELIEKLLE